MLAEKTSKPEARSEGKEWAISGFLLWMTALGKILQRNITGRKKRESILDLWKIKVEMSRRQLERGFKPWRKDLKKLQIWRILLLQITNEAMKESMTLPRNRLSNKVEDVVAQRTLILTKSAKKVSQAKKLSIPLNITPHLAPLQPIWSIIKLLLLTSGAVQNPPPPLHLHNYHQLQPTPLQKP